MRIVRGSRTGGETKPKLYAGRRDSRSTLTVVEARWIRWAQFHPHESEPTFVGMLQKLRQFHRFPATVYLWKGPTHSLGRASYPNKHTSSWDSRSPGTLWQFPWLPQKAPRLIWAMVSRRQVSPVAAQSNIGSRDTACWWDVTSPLSDVTTQDHQSWCHYYIVGYIKGPIYQRGQHKHKRDTFSGAYKSAGLVPFLVPFLVTCDTKLSF